MEDGVDKYNIKPRPPAVLPVANRPRHLAKPAKSVYRRNLPHFQAENKSLFITFATYQRWQLPETARAIVLKHCLHDHGKKLHMQGAVVMPEHAHLIFTPLQDGVGLPYGLAEIRSGINGASARHPRRRKHKEEPPRAAVLYFLRMSK